MVLHEGDTLVLWADDSFIPTWGESSVFLMLANGNEATEPVSRKKRWLALGLLIFMITGATVGELPVVKEAVPSMRLDMFFFVCITTIIMRGRSFSRLKIHEIHFLGYLDNDRLRFRYQQGHGEFRLCLHDSPPYNRYGRQFGAVCVAGDFIYYHQYIYGVDHEQRSGGFELPDRLVGGYAARR